MTIAADRIPFRSLIPKVPHPNILLLRDAVRAHGCSRPFDNMQPWSFVVVTDKSTLLKIADLSQTGRHIAGASFAVAVVVDPQNKWSAIDAARASQSMTIEGWDEGLGSGWVGTIDRDRVKNLLSIPMNLELLTVIPFGYPKKKDYKGKKDRKPSGEIIFSEKYGTPF